MARPVVVLTRSPYLRMKAKEGPTPDKASTVNCGEAVACATCVRCDTGTKIAVAHLMVDVDVSYA